MDHNGDSTHIKHSALLLQIANTSEQRALDQLLASHQQQLTATDGQGNTLLHYAVMLPVNVTLLQRLVRLPAINLTACNYQGATAADGLGDYLSIAKRLIDPDELDQIPQKIAEGDTASFNALVAANISLHLRYRTAHPHTGETLLHLALRYQHDDSIQPLYVLAHHQMLQNDDHNFFQILTSHNCSGQCPIEIAGTTAMLGKAAALLLSPAQAVGPSPFGLLQQQISALNRLALASPQPHPGEPLRAHLPTLCALAAFTCQRALANLASLSPTNKKYKQLLRQLLATDCRDDRAIQQLQQTIARIRNYLYHLVRQDRVSQSIALSTQVSDNRGWCDYYEHKIYLNPDRATHLIELVDTLLHETSHLVTNSYDFMYARARTLHSSRGDYPIDCKPCYQLAHQGESSYIKNLPVKMQTLLQCQAILKHGTQPVDFEKTYFQFLALNNAETIACTILGLATESRISKDHCLFIPLDSFSDSVITGRQQRNLAEKRLFNTQCSPARPLGRHAGRALSRTPGSLISTKAGSDASDDAEYTDCSSSEHESAQAAGPSGLLHAMAALHRSTGESAGSNPAQLAQHQGMPCLSSARPGCSSTVPEG